MTIKAFPSAQMNLRTAIQPNTAATGAATMNAANNRGTAGQVPADNNRGPADNNRGPAGQSPDLFQDGQGPEAPFSNTKGPGQVAGLFARPGTALTDQEKLQLQRDKLGYNIGNFSAKQLADAVKFLERLADSGFLGVRLKRDGSLTVAEAQQALGRISNYLGFNNYAGLKDADDHSYRQVLPEKHTYNDIWNYYIDLKDAASFIVRNAKIISKQNGDGMISVRDVLRLKEQGVLGPDQRLQGPERVTQDALIRQGWPGVSSERLRHTMKIVERFVSPHWVDGQMDRKELRRANDSLWQLLGDEENVDKNVEELKRKDDSWKKALGPNPKNEDVLNYYQRVANDAARVLEGFQLIAGLGENADRVDPTDYDEMELLGVMAPNPRQRK